MRVFICFGVLGVACAVVSDNPYRTEGVGKGEMNREICQNRAFST
jgi:hypothetical protein